MFATVPLGPPPDVPRCVGADSLQIVRREGGTQTREERSPSWCADEGFDLMDERGWLPESLSRKLLGASGLLAQRSRGVLCRAWVRDQPATTVNGQPGRERPPLPPPDHGPGTGFRGSLTPQMHVAVVRQNRASSVTLRSVMDQTRIDSINENVPVRFSPEAAFI